MTSENGQRLVAQVIGVRGQANSSDLRGKEGDRLGKVPSYHESKVVFDRLLAVVLLIPALPLMGLLIVLVRLTSPGPGLYAQTRLGKGRKSYVMYKLRSMRSDAEQKTGAAWCQEGDPRITWLGKILRKLHLDELPQLWNVVRGEMALVGPRPERPEFVTVLRQVVTDYDERMNVLPGVTGLSQINLPADSNVESVRRKLYLDRQYIAEANWFLDLRILACTALRLVGLSGRQAMQVTGCIREVDLPVGNTEQCSGSVTVSELMERHKALLKTAADDAQSISGDETLVDRADGSEGNSAGDVVAPMLVGLGGRATASSCTQLSEHLS